MVFGKFDSIAKKCEYKYVQIREKGVFKSLPELNFILIGVCNFSLHLLESRPLNAYHRQLMVLLVHAAIILRL